MSSSPPSAADRETPEAVFQYASRAVARGDWSGLFEALERSDVLFLASKSGLLGMADTQAIGARFGVDFSALLAQQKELAKAANAVLGGKDEDRTARSLNLRDLVKALESALDEKLQTIEDLPGFFGAIELAKRQSSGGGTISSSTFIDEHLEGLEISGKQARAQRRTLSGQAIPISFVKKSDGWYIKFRAR
ncbi:MAG: hypothetical protein U1E65_31200 [Myxococcota bacterium]